MVFLVQVGFATAARTLVPEKTFVLSLLILGGDAQKEILN